MFYRELSSPLADHAKDVSHIYRNIPIELKRIQISASKTLGAKVNQYPPQQQPHGELPHRQYPTPKIQKKWTTGKIVGLVASVLVGAVVLGGLAGAVTSQNKPEISTELANLNNAGDKDPLDQLNNLDLFTPNETKTKVPEGTAKSDRNYERWDESYVDSVRKNLPIVDYLSDDEVLDVTRLICERLDDDVTITSLHTDLSNKHGEFVSGFFLASTISLYCPEYQDEVDAWVTSLEEELGISSPEESSTTPTREHEVLIRTVRSDHKDLDTMSDADIIRVSEALCDNFDNAKFSLDSTQNIAKELQQSPRHVLILLVPASSFICPEHFNDAEDFTERLLQERENKSSTPRGVPHRPEDIIGI